jgi:hypothetical protein
MNDFSIAECQATLRADFHSFLVRCFLELNSGASFLPSWHIKVMAAKLQAVRDGRIRRLIINVPPRHLKSLASSIALPAWLLGHNPALAIINVTYGQELSDKFARDCRAIMMTPWYQSLFATRLASPRAPLAELATTRGGFRMATSVGGVLTGRGADLVLIDDPLKPSDAMSESRRLTGNERFDNTLYSRLNDKTRGAIVMVMQRLHEDDLVGHVLKQEGCEIVSFPAIAEADERHVVETAFGRREFFRRAGKRSTGSASPWRRFVRSARPWANTISPANINRARPPPAEAWSGRLGSVAIAETTSRRASTRSFRAGTRGGGRPPGDRRCRPRSSPQNRPEAHP